MDTAKQSQTPNTPAFPQESPLTATSKLQLDAQMPLSPTCEEMQSGSITQGQCSSAFGKCHSIVLDGVFGTSTMGSTSPLRPSAIYTRRTLRRRQVASQTCTNQARHYRQFAHLLRPLQSLVSVETGLPHPDFPHNMLQYHLLSHVQLDALAEHYYQSTPSYYSLGYPTTVVGRWWAPASEDDDTMGRDQHFEALLEEAKAIWRQIGAQSVESTTMDLRGSNSGKSEHSEEVARAAAETIIEDKRRRFGRFIGLRDCESPGVEDQQMMERAMEAWVWGEMDRRMRVDEDWQVQLGKGMY